jgi:hypothetical protein
MPLSAITARTVESPDIPYNNLRYNVQITTSIDPAGNLHASGSITFIACRVLPPATGQTASRWEDDPGRKPVVKSIADVFALAAQIPEVQAATDALNAAVAQYNQINNII